MGVHYNNDLKKARMEEVIDHIDAHATLPGSIDIGDGTPPALGNILVTITLQKPSFVEGSPGNVGVITMEKPTGGLSGTADDDGTATSAQIKDGAGTVVVSGLTVTNQAGTGEIKLNSVAISEDQTVTISQGTITHAS